jgi:hypothetical protein
MGRRFAVPLLLAAALSAACSKDDEAKPVHTFNLAPRSAPQVGPGVSTEGRDAGILSFSDLPEAPDAASAPTPPPVAAPTTAPAAAAPKANPDDPILERTRAACGQCFASLPARAGAPDRTAHVTVTVIPTGTVTRADVSSPDTTEPSVLDCIQSTAQSATFSDNGGGPLRTYAIDVRVHAGGPAGGR